MPQIHPSAMIEGDVTLADDVIVGPGCVLAGPITVGAGTRLIGNVYLHGPLEMGSSNLVYPFACLGFAPQHSKFDPATPGPGLVIGSGNTFREHVTIHRAYATDAPTRVGDGNLFMAASHGGHDCQVGSNSTITNGVLLGGHVEVGDRVTIGGNAMFQQFVRVGRGAMVSGRSAITMDVPPFAMVTGVNYWTAINLVGMRRMELPRSDIDDARWVHKIVGRGGHTTQRALELLGARADRPIVQEYITFFEGCHRGYCTKSSAVRHGMTHA